MADAEWRLEVGRFRAEHPQRTFPMGVHLGLPAGRRLGFEVPWPVPERYDAGLRFDLLSGLIERWTQDETVPPALWLSRQGQPTMHDQDALWHAAAVRASGGWDVALVAFRVITKAGWLDVPTGESRTWTRLRL